jgi:tRNA-dihydrouridine synthase
MIQETGISHFAVHFRLKDQTAKFKADWKKIKDVVSNFNIFLYL